MAAKVVKQLAGDGSGQSLSDMMTAFKHTIAGSQIAKVICKATTEEMIPPKKKHLNTLVRCTFQPRLSVPDFSNVILDRTQHSNLIVVFKAFVTIHHLMQFGHERFFQYIASNNCRFYMPNFNERSNSQGHGIRVFIHVYAKYLEEKALSYRELAGDVCRFKIGKEGAARTVSQEKLFKMIPVIERLLDALLAFDATSNELVNPLLRVAHLSLYRDLIHLCAVHNEAMINLIGRYFTMSKRDCQFALTCYKSFVGRLPLLNSFVKVAEQSAERGLQPGESESVIFKPIPGSVLEALEQHLAFLKNPSKQPSSSVPSGSSTNNLSKQVENCPAAGSNRSIDDGSSANGSSTNVTLSEEERKRIIEEERARLESFICTTSRPQPMVDERNNYIKDFCSENDFIEQLCAKSNRARAVPDEKTTEYAKVISQYKSTICQSKPAQSPWSTQATAQPATGALGIPMLPVSSSHDEPDSNATGSCISASLFDIDPFSPPVSGPTANFTFSSTSEVPLPGSNPFGPSSGDVLVPANNFPNRSSVWDNPSSTALASSFPPTHAASALSLDDRLSQLACNLSIVPSQRLTPNHAITCVDWSGVGQHQQPFGHPAISSGTGPLRTSTSVTQLTGPVIQPASGVTNPWYSPPASYQFSSGLPPGGIPSAPDNPWYCPVSPTGLSSQHSTATRSTNPFL